MSKVASGAAVRARKVPERNAAPWSDGAPGARARAER